VPSVVVKRIDAKANDSVVGHAGSCYADMRVRYEVGCVVQSVVGAMARMRNGTRCKEVPAAPEEGIDRIYRIDMIF